MLSLHAVTRNEPKSSGEEAAAPWTVFVHGLDSSSKTWKDTMEHLDTPCLAIDQRGSGYSPLGNPDDFSQDSLVEDLHQVILDRCGQGSKIVLVGHSLGGRVVLGYAAAHPERIAALIIEDMDIAERSPGAHGIVKLKPYDGVFDRHRPSKELVLKALQEVGYPPEFLEKGLASGRIEPNRNDTSGGGSWWTHINPDFRKLCYPHVLSTSQARNDCTRLSLLCQENKIGFPCHVLIAGQEGTVCIEESIQEMKQILSSQLTIHRYPTAGHSIHSTSPQYYRTTLTRIIQAAK